MYKRAGKFIGKIVFMISGQSVPGQKDNIGQKGQKGPVKMSNEMFIPRYYFI